MSSAAVPPTVLSRLPMMPIGAPVAEFDGRHHGAQRPLHDQVPEPWSSRAATCSSTARSCRPSRTRTDIQIIKVPANEIADELGNPKVANLVMAGAYIGYTELLPPEKVLATAFKKLGAKRPRAQSSQRGCVQPWHGDWQGCQKVSLKKQSSQRENRLQSPLQAVFLAKPTENQHTFLPSFCGDGHKNGLTRLSEYGILFLSTKLRTEAPTSEYKPERKRAGDGDYDGNNSGNVSAKTHEHAGCRDC